MSGVTPSAKAMPSIATRAERFAAPPPEIATKAEHDHLVENRPEPAPQPHLTPLGFEAADVRQRIDAEHERRIGALRSSLDYADYMLQTGYRQARLHGHAKADFGRSR